MIRVLISFEYQRYGYGVASSQRFIANECVKLPDGEHITEEWIVAFERRMLRRHVSATCAVIAVSVLP